MFFISFLFSQYKFSMLLQLKNFSFFFLAFSCAVVVAVVVDAALCGRAAVYPCICWILARTTLGKRRLKLGNSRAGQKQRQQQQPWQHPEAAQRRRTRQRLALVAAQVKRISCAEIELRAGYTEGSPTKRGYFRYSLRKRTRCATYGGKSCCSADWGGWEALKSDRDG